MAVENGFNVGKSSYEASTSTKNEEMEKGFVVYGNSQDTERSKEDEKTNLVPFRQLFSFADYTDIMSMVIGTIGAVGNGFLFVPIRALRYGTSVYLSDQGYGSKVCLKFVYLAVGACAAAFLQVACWMVTGERQAVRIRGLYLKTILRQDIAFFDKETNTGEVIGRMSGDTFLIQDAMGEKLVSMFIGGFVIAFIKGWLLTLVMLSSIPLIVIAGAIMSIVVARSASRGQNAYARAATVVEKTIGSIRTVASFTGEKQAISNYKKFLLSTYNSGVHEGFATGLGLGVVFLIIFCGYALAMWFGGKMVLEKGYTGGQASPCMSSFASGQAAAYKMFETINRKPQIDVYDTKGKVLDDINEDIEFREVYFSYPARPEEQIFTRFSLSIPSGTTAALVGQSGSGKSTVISLMERFYDPRAGEVLRDDINIKELQLKWIRGKIGLVSQEPVLFTASIRDNIAYGKDGATTEQIRAAAELANAAKFIDKLPQGIDSMAGEHGTQLSCGQKQRIAIARATLKDPRILLLDEATSALDAESERTVQEALDKIMVNRTTVVVAHCLSTIRNADIIAVIHHGKTAEIGSHLELLEDPHGVYSQLICLQEVYKDAEQAAERLKVSESPLEEPEVSPPLGKTPEVLIRRLVHLNKPEIPVLIAGAIVASINGVIFPIYGMLLSRAIKSFYEPPHELRKDSEFWAIILMILGLASFWLHMEGAWFDQPEHSNGAIGARLSADAAIVSAWVGDALAHLVQNIVSAIAGLIIAFTASWQLAFIVVVLIPLIGINGYVEVKFVKVFSKDAKEVLELLPLSVLKMRYPSRPDVQIFQDLSLAIHSGEIVALVGESGSGKSTVISLLQRFYDPDSGHIALDGVEIKRLQLKWKEMQRKQKFWLHQSWPTGFISGLQQGYDTAVGERGVQLSGGRKQRVAIARAKNQRYYCWMRLKVRWMLNLREWFMMHWTE
ncbi:hypothetical protein JCGZ_14107 [Jatropha curcas]|uniref:Uncharacterized protein n=1 Tax=Jatropha curcas TaxID=180498 RepID=A0A067JWJ6_JATCU|nr:hypothetical protein JCGZ_14107 [Jatropha curcas]